MTETLAIREKIPQVEVAAGDAAAALVFRVLEPPGADDLAKIARFGIERGLQIFLQTGGPDSIRPLRSDYPALAYALDEGRILIEFGPVDFIQINRDINVSMVEATMNLLGPNHSDSVLDLFC